MGNFKINIKDTPILYSGKTSYITYDRCSSSINVNESIQLVNSDNLIFSLLSNYTGSQKSKLVITSINTYMLTCKYNNIEITNNDLPLEINISSLNDNDNIPLLQFENTMSIEPHPEDNLQGNCVIFFYVEDDGGQKGSVVSSSFQILTTPCNQLSSLTSQLPLITDGDGIIDYTLTSTNQPTKYSVLGLPAGIEYDNIENKIIGTSTKVGLHNISILIYNEKGVNTINSTIQVINPVIELSPPVITSTLFLNYTHQFILSYLIEATNNPTHFEITLPPELQYHVIFDDTLGLLKGKNPNIENGVYNIGLKAYNDGGFDSKTLQVTIDILDDDYLDGDDYLGDDHLGDDLDWDNNHWDLRGLN